MNTRSRTKRRKSKAAIGAALCITAACLGPMCGCGQGTKPQTHQTEETIKEETVKQKPARQAAAPAVETKAAEAAIPADYRYDPTGKIDPFLPLIREEGTVDQLVVEGPLTPLQRYSLSELKLVAVILAGDQSKAMVEDSRGDGYILTKGTMVGNKHGQVAEIRQNEVVIVEKEINPSTGGVTHKQVSLVLHKSEEETL